jgi:UDP-N-acetylmuramyl pentapeptide phosphotransferase/UDP-N-acetylglucosamine-1-phosphate transferase
VSLAERVLVSLVVSVTMVYLVTPYAIALADRLQFYDKPVGYKGHLKPTPYLGGAAVMAGFALSVLLVAGDWQRNGTCTAAAASTSC